MNEIEFNNLNKDDFLEQADLSTKNHICFTKFVQNAEAFCTNKSNIVIESKLSSYRKIWLDLEIINSLALEDWETEGKSSDWVSQWEERYKDDVREVIEKLRSLLLR